MPGSTATQAQAHGQDVTRARASRPAVALAATVIAGAGAAAAAVLGLMSRPVPIPFTTARGQSVELFGGGVYRYDSLFSGAANRGTDIVTLLIVLPLLVLAVVGHRRGSLRATMTLTGLQGWLLYVYATMAVGAAFGPLFLVYVIVFSASLWAIVLTTLAIDAPRLTAALPGLPHRALAVFMMVSGAVTAAIWVVPVLAAQWSGAVPAHLDAYSTLVTVALDSAVITPAALAAGGLIWQRRSTGYRIAVPLLILETLLAPMIVAQTVSQLSAGINLTPAELVGPLAGFALLALAAGAALVAVLRALPGRPTSPPPRRADEDLASAPYGLSPTDTTAPTAVSCGAVADSKGGLSAHLQPPRQQ